MDEKKKGHFLDLKLPLGGLLGFYGLVLGLYGLFTDEKTYQKSLGINVNLIWGAVLLVIGGAMILLSLRKSPRP
jgi:membrane-bound ClpP family serine protease